MYVSASKVCVVGGQFECMQLRAVSSGAQQLFGSPFHQNSYLLQAARSFYRLRLDKEYFAAPPPGVLC